MQESWNPVRRRCVNCGSEDERGNEASFVGFGVEP